MVLKMLENVQQMSIQPVITTTVVAGSCIYTDEYVIYNRLVEWGYQHETVNHSVGEYARDDDGDGFCEIHVNTMEGIWSLLRSWLHPIGGFHRTNYLCTWDSSSLFTTFVVADTLFYPVSSILFCYLLETRYEPSCFVTKKPYSWYN